MRNFSANVRTLLTSDNVSTFVLVELDTTSQIYRETNLSYNITIDGNLYTANSRLAKVEAPRLSSAVDREPYKVTYIDTDFSKRLLFENGLAGALLTVFIGFFNTTDSVLGGAQPGAPLLNPVDIIIAYAGFIDNHGYSIDPDSGDVFATIEGASPMASLDLTRSFYTSKEKMRQVNATDTSFDQVSINSSKTTYLWGKA